ncbi:ABC transporter ATP-binding protein [Flavobacterium sp. HSC-61S13]|uniref:ABC transporter ATP-binding protein n=1 Tax=Flavobacterium sp. HSC-61S13 TaxID=2910963 RepID=UPI00209DFBAB|nr:ABC transporter ATP-binding protein [Flavobacterium sp. HSC-61S13]MCP1995788.1 iron complex transport system ATP-binding protein [Flavobacterium sp. HSC-61S13]
MLPILEAKNLTVGYTSKSQKQIIASAIDFQLYPNKLISLLGLNGIGKSTLLRTLSGVQPLLDGDIYIDNKALNNYTQADLATLISVVLTEKIPKNQLTVYELVALGRIPYTDWIGNLKDTDLAMIQMALTATETLQIQHKTITQISDGQLQKVLIARAIAQDTPIIILDEPSTHLDLYNKIMLFKLLKRLCQTHNKCILFSTHDMDLALQMSDELLLMRPQGLLHGATDAIIESDVLDRLFDDPSIRFNKEQKRFILDPL